MEIPRSREEEEASIIFEAEQLAEKYGMELSKLAEIIGKKPNEQEAVQSNDTENEKGELVEELRTLVGRNIGAIEYDGVKIEEIRSSSSRIVEILEELGYSPGSNATVERSSGDIEMDWGIESIDVRAGIVKVFKEEEDKRLEKEIPIQDFLGRNLDIHY